MFHQGLEGWRRFDRQRRRGAFQSAGQPHNARGGLGQW